MAELIAPQGDPPEPTTSSTTVQSGDNPDENDDDLVKAVAFDDSREEPSAH